MNVKGIEIAPHGRFFLNLEKGEIIPHIIPEWDYLNRAQQSEIIHRLMENKPNIINFKNSLDK